MTPRYGVVLQTKTNPLEVRLAALGAWRRAPCEQQPSAAFLKLYTDQRQDVELRIAGYLAAMRCPSPSTLRVVKDTLYAEDVNQGLYQLEQAGIILTGSCG